MPIAALKAIPKIKHFLNLLVGSSERTLTPGAGPNSDGTTSDELRGSFSVYLLSAIFYLIILLKNISFLGVLGFWGFRV